jgi:hypothetical protein
MSISTAVLWLGPSDWSSQHASSGYGFLPVPQVGCRDDYQRAGESKLAPTNKHRIVTLHGHFSGANLNAIQTKIAALRTALSKEGQVLYFHDGTAIRINNEEVVVDNVDIPVQWGQYRSDYTVQLSYWPLDDVHKAPAVVSYGTFVFCNITDKIAQPMPLLGRELKVERQTPDADRESARVTLTLSGFFDEGSMSANQTKLAALNTALVTDGLTLIYGSFSQSVKVLGWTHHEDTLQRRIGYVVQFQYTETAKANGVVKMSSMRRITRVTQRHVEHLVPYVDYASVQVLGRGGQKITATGYIIADTLADARIAAQIEIDAQFPVVATPAELVYAYGATYAGVEDQSSNVVEYADQKRCDWQIERFYGTPGLSGGLYGTGL